MPDDWQQKRLFSTSGKHTDKFPTIVYSLDDIDPVYANGGVYLSPIKYSVIVIDDDPDTEIVGKVSALPLCRFVRPYVSNNLNHYVFELYY